VPAAVARPFAYGSDPFRAGQHRGVDFAAPPGSEARAACSGVVATARPGLVTLRCGPWRVTHLPLGSVSVAEGASVRAGRVIGSVGFSSEHRGLHLGVRRTGDRFAYVDPLTFLGGRTTAPPTVPPPRTVRVPRSGPSGARPSGSPAPAPASPPAAAGVSSPESRLSAPHSALGSSRVRSLSPVDDGGLAPWPAWVGLALLLVGAVGGGVRVRARRARAGAAAPLPSAR
jgi:hypothetical protein